MILSAADAANAPPALVLNENVASHEDLTASRCACNIWNVGLATLSPIWPDAMVVGLALASAVVWMEIALAPANTTPMVSPVSVMVTAVMTAISGELPIFISVSTMELELNATLFMEMEPLMLTCGNEPDTKKSVG